MTNTGKEVKRGTMKRPYFKCSCGHINYIGDNMILPDRHFIIDIDNPRDANEKSAVGFICKCGKRMEIGMMRAATERDN